MKLSEQMKNAGTLLDATSAIGNWRALLLCAATTVSSIAIFTLLSLSGNGALTALGALLALISMFYGINAVGILLMSHCGNNQRRSMGEAVLASLFTGHRLLGVGLAAFLGFCLLLIAVAIVLFLCKIPVLGPVLLVIALPLCALLVGAAIFAVSYVFYPLAAAAIWSGATVKDALVNLMAITRQRLLSVVIKELILMLVTGVVSLLLLGIVFSGIFTVGSMSAGILGGSQNMMGLAGMMMGGGMHDGMGGHMVAAGVGISILLALISTIPSLIMLQGFCEIYLGSLRGLDTDTARAAIEARARQMEAKTAEIKEKLEAQRARIQAQSQAATVPQIGPASDGTSPAESAIHPACPQCQHPQEEADAMFCGNCGHKLR